MRNRHKAPQNVTNIAPSSKFLDENGERVSPPWETAAELRKFEYFIFNGPGPSVRGAYRDYCKAKGIEPKKDPPSTWYQLYNGRTAAIRKAEMQTKALERAETVHGRVPDWDMLADLAASFGDLGQYDGEFGEVMDSLTLIDYAFQSLAIDNNGDPLPGRLPWIERAAAYWAAVGRGEVKPPEQPKSDATTV